MNCLRCGVTAVILFAVLGTSTVSEADPISYSFFGVLGDCEIPFQGGCLNAWKGQTVSGSFTFDDALGTYTAFAFFGPMEPFNWVGPIFPDPNPPYARSSTFVGNASELRALETVFVPGEDLVFLLDLRFTTPLNAFSPSQITTSPQASASFIYRGDVPIRANFASGQAQPMPQTPEPSSIFLLGTGIVALGTWRNLRHTAAPLPSEPH